MSRSSQVVTAFGVLTALALAVACKPGPPPPACAATFKDMAVADQNSLFTICSCPANAGTGEGSVWGSGVYTTDSNICKAAVHAGAVTSSGGTVTVKKTAGCGSYTGTTANGVTTQSWGSFDSSFYFSGSGTGVCPGASAGVSPSGRPAPPPSAGAATPSGAPSARPGPSAAPSARH